MIFEDEQDFALQYPDISSPLSAENPVGEDLRSSSHPIWHELRNARQGEREGNLRPAGAEIHAADWESVERLSLRALNKQSKDLQIAIWLCQALTLTRALNGLAEGLFVIRLLVASFWNSGLYPSFEDDEEGPGEGRSDLMLWFDNELALWIKLAPFTPVSSSGVVFSLADHANALSNVPRIENANEYRARSSEMDERLEEEFQAALNSAPFQFIKDSSSSVQLVLVQLHRLQECLGAFDCSVPFDATLKSLAMWEAVLAPSLNRKHVTATIASPAARQPAAPVRNPTEENWQRALDLVRSQQFDQASDLLGSVFAEATSERERFLRKIDFAAVLFEVKRYEQAIGMLRHLNRQIDRYQLQTWEDPKIAVRVWKLLYDCYGRSGAYSDEAREVEAKLIRVAPWMTLR